MRKFIVLATLSLAALSGQAQDAPQQVRFGASASEKVMNILKTDGTCTQTRVADLSQISFLTVDEGGQGLVVKTLGGETAAVLFETNPIVTISNGKLIVKPSSDEAVEFEITDIAEILFRKASDDMAINELKDFDFVLQEDGALLRGIPKGVTPRVYSLDGRTLPTPPFLGSELRLSRTTLGSGIFIVKVGTFTIKIKF